MLFQSSLQRVIATCGHLQKVNVPAHNGVPGKVGQERLMLAKGAQCGACKYGWEPEVQNDRAHQSDGG